MAADHLDETCHFVISTFVARGQAPHFTGIAAHFGEHAEQWPEFKPGTEAGLLTLADAMRVMSAPRHRDRLRPDYVSRLPETVPAFVQRLLEVSHDAPFWDLRPG